MQETREVDLKTFVLELTPKYRLASAIELATRAHYHQFDSAGAPYILHPLRVMAAVGTADHELAAIAVLHDVLEDHPHRRPEVELISTPRMMRALELLTHTGGEYASYCLKLAPCDDARRVKIADIRDNLDITRFTSAVPAKWVDRKMHLYVRALQWFAAYEADKLRDEQEDEDV